MFYLGAWAAEFFGTAPVLNISPDSVQLKRLMPWNEAARGANAVFALPYAVFIALIAPIRRKFSAKQTSFYSACAFCRPLKLNCRNPSTLLIQPLGGSANHLRFR